VFYHRLLRNKRK